MATHAAENQAYVLEEKDPVSVVLFFHRLLGHWGWGGGGGGWQQGVRRTPFAGSDRTLECSG